MGSAVSRKKKKLKLNNKESGKSADDTGSSHRSRADEGCDERTRDNDNEESEVGKVMKDEESDHESMSEKEIESDQSDDEREEQEEDENETTNSGSDNEADFETSVCNHDKDDEAENINDKDHEEKQLLTNLSYTEAMERAMVGDLSVQYPSNAKVVRIFTSSTFTDTFVERNTLMEKVYPKLKDYCQERGYDFQVVDMRWGVRDEATDDHKTSELCMKEIYACQRLSTGPNFVTFLGQKYGYRPFPPKIAASELEKLLDAVEKQDDKNLLTHWFRRDDNCVPPEYLLQPVTSLLPDYRNYDNEELRKKASGEWWGAFERMQIVLRKASDKVLCESKKQKYYMSVTEDEIRRGILTAPEEDKHCLWFKRTITNLDQNIDKSKAGSFMDKTWGKSSSVDQEAQTLLNHLKDEISKKLPKDNIKNYDVLWTDKGIDTAQSSEHAQYIEKLCMDFYEKLTALINAGIMEKEAAKTTDPVAEEIFQHSSFCQSKANTFHGREEFLSDVKETIKTIDSRVVVLYGPSGCGKTSLMAKIATQIGNWFDEEGSPIVVIRFIGTTPDSSSIRFLLRSICLQLCKATQQPESSVPEDMKSLIEFFSECLTNVSETKPVILLLDSLDQSSIDEGGREMGWFPKQLQYMYNVYVVLSTLPDDEYQCLGNLKIKFPDECFKEVPPIPLNEADQILDLWLKNVRRSLLPSQKQCVMDSFKNCQLPLYLKLAFDEAIRWKSYYQPNETILAANVQDIISALFDRIERAHGKTLVCRSLAYITASKNGLTEPELEDLLSLDDTVLNDVYQYWTPPVRRLPPLLWIRIRSEINDYLIDRGADGTRVIYWYHRQFIEVAQQRYLQSEEAAVIHSNMSEYFLGTWSGKTKPYEDKSGKRNSMDRLVARQPLMFDNSLKNPVFNLRKLSELPFHLLQSCQYDRVVQECLCNFEFLLAKLRGLSLESVLDDFTSYLEVKPEDTDVKLLCDTLRLATFALKHEPNQLPSQLIGRMFKFLQREKQYPLVYKVLKEAQSCSIPCFIPNMRCLTAPGGALVSTFPLSGMSTDFVSVAKDNKTIAITVYGGEGFDIKIVDSNSGKELRKFTLLEPVQIYRTNYNKISDVNTNKIFLAGSNTVFLLNTLTGKFEKSFQITEDEWFGYSRTMPICFPDDENLLAVIGPESLIIWNVSGGLKLHDIKVKGIKEEATEIGTIHSLGNLIVYNIDQQFTIHIVNAVSGKEMQKIDVNFKGKKDRNSVVVTIKEVKLIPNEQVLVLPSSCDQLRLYDIKSGSLTRELNQFNMIQNMGQLQITDDGRKVATIDMYEINITDLETGDVEHCLRSPVMRMQNYTRDGVHFFSVGVDQVLRVYDRSLEDLDENKGEVSVMEYEVKEHGRSYRISDQVSALTPCPDGRHVITMATIAMKNVVSIWDTMTGQKIVDISGLTVYPNPLRMSSPTCGIGFIYDQNNDHHYKIFNFEKGVVERSLCGKACKRTQAFGMIDGRRMMSFSKGRRLLKIWDIDSGKVVRMVNCGQKYRFEEMLLSGNQKLAVLSQVSQTSSDADYKEKTLPLILFDTESFEHKNLVLKDQQLGLYNAKIDKNGRYLVTIVDWYHPLLWDIQEGILKHRLHLEDSYASFADVSSVSMVAVTADNQGGLRVWDIESGRQLRKMGEESSYIALSLSETGKYAFTQSSKSTIFDAWDIEAGIKMASFTIDGTSSMSKPVGDTFTMAVAENPNLVILRLYQPGVKHETTPSEYSRLSLPTEMKDISGNRVLDDEMDDDKDDDTGQLQN